MKVYINYLFQGAAALIVFANLHGSLIPAKYQWLLGIAVTLAQGVISIKAHYSNPDGSSARLPWQPDAPGNSASRGAR
jgi:hypothetical protein